MEKHRAATHNWNFSTRTEHVPEQCHPEPIPGPHELEMNSLDLPQLFLQSLQKNIVQTSGPTTLEFFTTVDYAADKF